MPSFIEEPAQLQFSIEEPKFEWALRPGKIKVLDDTENDFLFGINHPSEEQFLEIEDFFIGHPPESFKIFRGYTMQFVCGLESDFITKKKDYQNLDSLVCFTNIRTSLGVEFKLAFGDWF